MKRALRPRTLECLASACVVLLCCAEMASAHAWSLTVNAASRRVYLHVGNGTFDGNNGTINMVQVAVPFNLVGNGAAQAMTSNSTQSISLQGDGYNTCPTPASQVMIGASYRRSNGGDGPASATLSVSSPASLNNGNGDTIPISQIRWTVAAPGSDVPNVIPAGTFNGGTQTLATVPANRYIENCHTYSYANSAVVPAGTYNGRVTYTLTSP